MKNMVLVLALVATGLSADALTDMATEAATSKAKTEVKKEVVKHVAGDNIIKQAVVGQAADKALAGDISVNKVTDDVVAQAKDKAVDVAAEEASKAVGKETLGKDTAKNAIKSVI